jgi:peptide/nickel transport system substrate-binding protein
LFEQTPTPESRNHFYPKREITMKPIRAIQKSVIVLGIALGALAGAPAFAAGKPVVFLDNVEPVGLDPMFSSASPGIMLSIHETLFRLDNDGKVVPAGGIDQVG